MELSLNSIIWVVIGLAYPVAFLAGAQYGKRANIGGTSVKAKLRKDIAALREKASAELKAQIAKVKDDAKDAL